MKRCPECRRDYYDDSLLYCLDDGSALLDGPAFADEAVTAILTTNGPAVEASQKRRIAAADARNLRHARERSGEFQAKK